jgi:hypothetical protein
MYNPLRMTALAAVAILLALPAFAGEKAPAKPARSAWDTQVAKSPEAQQSYTATDRKILQSITARQYAALQGGARPEDIRLSTGESLASMIARVQAAAGDLVFTALPPCRLIDTRLAGGAFAPSETRSYTLRGPATDYTSYGGNASGCGIPGLVGSTLQENEAKALSINIIAVSPAGSGHFVAWPTNQAPPVASVINYANVTGLNIANGIILPMCDEVSATPCTAGDISFLAAVSGVHLVVDVTGYFHAPVADVDVTSVTAGTGLDGGGTGDVTLSILPEFQLPQSCTDGQIASWDDTNDVWVCADDQVNPGDITGVAADTGLSGGGTSGDVSLAVAGSYRLPQSCTDGQLAKWNSGSSLWECVSPPAPGPGFTKANIYEVVEPEQLPGGAGMTVTETASCADANDIPLEGACRPVTSGTDDVVIASEFPQNWSSGVTAASFQCVFRNMGATMVNTQTRILCITVP